MPAATTVGIAGAGLLGRLLAWRLARPGLRVEVYDPAPAPGRASAPPATRSTPPASPPPACSARWPSSTTPAPEVAALGWRSIDGWRAICEALSAPPAFAQRGSLLLAHRSDLGAARRVLARLDRAPAGRPAPRPLDAGELAALEPALQGAAHAWLLPGEAQIDTVAAMLALHADAAAAGAAWHWGRRVAEVQPGGWCSKAASRGASTCAVDVRGAGARPPCRCAACAARSAGCACPAHGLTRPARLLHPRHRVYLVPRGPTRVLVGASEVESEDRSRCR